MIEANSDYWGTHNITGQRSLGDTVQPGRYDGERLVQHWLTGWRKTLIALLAMIEEKSAKTEARR